MEESVKQRLVIYIKHLGITVRDFERRCNLSNGYIRGLKDSPRPNRLADILSAYPQLNKTWLLTGEGEMLLQEDSKTDDQESKVQHKPQSKQGIKPYWKPEKDYRLVPMYNLDARGGFAGNSVLEPEYIVDMIPFKNAHEGDIAICISGDSMSPTYRAGSIVLLHCVEDWFDFLELGQVYVIELRDGRRLIKELRRSEVDYRNNFLCVSHNQAFEPVELPKRLIVRVYLVRAVYAKTSM